jgi:hypothetical protein
MNKTLTNFAFFCFLIFPIYLNATTDISYNRKDWKHWLDDDKDCQNTRAEILIARSKVPVTFTSMKNCTVLNGKWDDFYFNEIHFIASQIDIDHVIPLKHAHDIGGYQWSAQRKKEFANDEANLAVTNRKYNRQKGAQTIATWLPIEKKYACRYVNQWINIKNKYQLPFSDKENQTIKQIRPECLKLDFKF